MVVNSRMLLHAAYCYGTKNNSLDHIKYCTYLILLVRNLYFQKYEDISSSNKKILVGLGLQQSYDKLKKEGCVHDITNYFTSQTGHNGSTNIEHLNMWIYWMVDKFTISLCMLTLVVMQ